MRQSDSTPNPRRDDAIDEIIRRRFASCPTLPLFPEPPPAGFFQLPDTGRQLRLIELPRQTRSASDR